MGCSNGKPGASDSLFKVYNLDQDGTLKHKGRFEVTGDELVLHQKHREKMNWPLRCLRRYGYQSNMFSFECGRRSPTGAGIYAFKCKEAERLFNLVQESINSDGLAGAAVELRNGGLDEHDIDRNGEDGGGTTAHNYVNTMTATTESGRVSYSQLSEDERGQYVNVNTSVPASRTTYTNVSTPAPISTTALQYIELDLNNTPEATQPSTPASPKSCGSNQLTEGYATIDFERTAALSTTYTSASGAETS
ncbi:unnamed protein product [Dimorphilus gyrociliatus]|uniref:IRS-type PTB domain-containing protein n=1 Tax=Dimorphilus gyrociliatus TaxID=2664684 RepID=A0A7I8VHJ9_9ANNE|nr:unnamed protein product [Dimorphilus gyrociliatus]